MLRSSALHIAGAPLLWHRDVQPSVDQGPARRAQYSLKPETSVPFKRCCAARSRTPYDHSLRRCCLVFDVQSHERSQCSCIRTLRSRQHDRSGPYEHNAGSRSEHPQSNASGEAHASSRSSVEVRCEGPHFMGGTNVIQPLIDANTRLARSDFPDFNFRFAELRSSAPRGGRAYRFRLTREEHRREKRV
jgi:hypothetical protein